MSHHKGLWASVVKAASDTPRQYFAPLTWSIAWISGVLRGHSHSVPSFWDWVHGIRHVTPPGGNVFLDLGFSPEKAAELQIDSYRKIVKRLQDTIDGPYTFILDDTQVARFETWKVAQDRKVVELQKNSLPDFEELTTSGMHPHYGSCSGGYTFSFSPSGIRTFVIVSNCVTKEELNLTQDL